MPDAQTITEREELARPGRAVRAAEALHAMALGLWGGAVVTAGGVAAIIFPTMRDADVQLPGLAAYADDHWPIAAGQVMNKVFLIVDWLGIAALTVAMVTLALVLLQRRTRHIGAATAIRLIAIGMLIVVTGYVMLFLRPAMQSELDAYWTAAQAGDLATATSHRNAFDALHPTASFTITMQLVLIVVALVSGIMCATIRPTSTGSA